MGADPPHVGGMEAFDEPPRESALAGERSAARPPRQERGHGFVGALRVDASQDSVDCRPVIRAAHGASMRRRVLGGEVHGG
jgi:hypothetical protein